MSKKTIEQDKLRKAAEAKLPYSADSQQMPRPAERLLHELRVHQIELEILNEALRQSQIELENSRNRYVDFYDFAAVGYLTLSHEAMIDEINLTGAMLLGVGRNKLPHRGFAPFVAAEDCDRWHRHFLAVQKSDSKRSCELVLQRDDGSRFHAQLDCLRVAKTDGTPVVRIVMSNITERKQTEEQLRISNLRFEAVLEAVPDLLFEVDRNGRYLNVWGNRGDLLAASENMLLGRTVEEMLPSSAAREVLAAIAEADMNNQSFGRQVKLSSPRGDSWFELSVAKQPSVVAHEARFIVVSRDITERKLAEEKIHKLAFYDTLTQLPNRRLLIERLEQAMVASKRSNLYGALIFMDMDNFKPLNDTHGHETGDLLLIEVAHRISGCVREIDTVARFGGDEFVVALRELDVDKAKSAEQAGIVARKIGIALAQPYVLKIRHEGKEEALIEHQCTTSIGVVLFIKHEASTEEIINWADIAMYQAKEAGGNQIRFYEPKT
ncbi:MAG: diguanylate cyclase domain-containing protein [Pseudomonadota bacterium]